MARPCASSTRAAATASATGRSSPSTTPRAENDQRVFLVFALLILGGAGLAAFNLVSRVVEAQRREIGIGMALGVSPLALAIRPLLLGLQVGVLAAALGIAVAIGTAELFKPLLDGMLPLPVIETPFQTGAFLTGALLGLVIPLMAAALPVWRSVRVAPVEAIRVGFRSAKGGGLADRLGWLPMPRRSLGRMPVRNVLRTPRRTAMTVLGVAAVIAVIVAIGGMIDSLGSSTRRATAEAERMTPDRVVVTLDAPRRASAPAVHAVLADASVGRAEPVLRLAATVRAHGEAIDVGLHVADPDSALWRPSVTAGAAPDASLGVLLSQRAADELGVAPGDPVVVDHPRRTESGTLGAATTRAPVAGVHGSPFRQIAVAGPAWASAAGLEGLTNEIWLAPADGASTGDVRQALSGRPGVASVEEAAAASRTLEDALGQFADVLRIGWAFAIALALLMAFNATTINAEERRREHATMFAFGVRPRAVIALQVAESVLIGLLATVVGILLGRLILAWVVGALIPDTFPDLGIEAAIGATTIVAASLAGVLALALGPLLTAGPLRRMDVPSTLRVME